MIPAARLSPVFLLLAASLGLAEEVPPPSFPSAVELITIDAVVLDNKGNLVTGLTQDDFVVLEDKQPQRLVSFEAFSEAPPARETTAPPAAATGAPAPQGRPYALIVDDLRIAPLLVPPMRRALTSFVKRSLRDGDEVMLATSSGAVGWRGRIPEGRDELLRALGRIEGRDWSYGDNAFRPAGQSVAISEYRYFKALRASGRARGDAEVADARRRWRMERTLRAVDRAFDGWKGVRGRKSLVLLSEGFLQDGGSELREVTAVAREANAAIYFIDVRGLVPPQGYAAEFPARSADGSPAENAGPAISAEQLPDFEGGASLEERAFASGGSRDLADATGGFSVRDNDIERGLHRAASESRTFYLLGFHPPDGKPASDWRSLRVEVRRPGLTVRARTGYRLRATASTPASPTVGASGPPAGEQQTVAVRGTR